MKISTSLFIAVILAFTGSISKESDKKKNKPVLSFSQYTHFVQDSFQIDVQLPLEYNERQDKSYPTVYVLDSDFYFPMLSAMFHQYEVTGLLPPMILVGIGYGSIHKMDSLRVRDYLYPEALPSDEMDAPGGGLNFNRYLTEELLPEIDAEFRTLKDNRSLLGHSFGGYFVLFSLLEQLKTDSGHFQKFVSASPALWYHNFYLFQIPQELRELPKEFPLQLYLSVGGEENETWSIKPVRELADELLQLKLDSTYFQYKLFDHLDHMDTGLLTFVKGLQDF